MSIPAEYDFQAENVGIIELISLDTTVGVCRFLLGDDARFYDVDGNEWLGSKLITVSDVDYSINGNAPSVEFTFSFIQDPDADDLVARVKALGIDCVKGRDATMYMQYVASFGEIFKPVYPPLVITKRKMQNITYVFDGPQIRAISLTVEGPFALRSKPVGLRYNTADHSRLVGYDNPSLEFMPTNNFDEQPLFGL